MITSPINPIHRFNSYSQFDKQWCTETAKVLLKSLDHSTPITDWLYYIELINPDDYSAGYFFTLYSPSYKIQLYKTRTGMYSVCFNSEDYYRIHPYLEISSESPAEAVNFFLSTLVANNSTL